MDADNEIESLGGDENNPIEGEEDVAFSRRTGQRLIDDLAYVIEIDSDLTLISWGGNSTSPLLQALANEEWEEIGRAISSNINFHALQIMDGALDDHKMTYLFKGLTASKSIRELILHENGLSAAGLSSMESFLYNSKNLRLLKLVGNNIGSEGFNYLLQALFDINIVETMNCSQCGIESIQIDNNCVPRSLVKLVLGDNNIDASGCKELAKLLEGKESALEILGLENNKIGDEGVVILADALKKNTTLKSLHLNGIGMSTKGRLSLLALVNDISTIKATLHSNHTLTTITKENIEDEGKDFFADCFIEMALAFNRQYIGNFEVAGKEKLIRTQLGLQTRKLMAYIQGVQQSLYSQINPLHLPEVLSVIGRRLKVGELNTALRTFIVELLETVNRKKCLQQKMEYHLAQVEQIRAELEVI